MFRPVHPLARPVRASAATARRFGRRAVALALAPLAVAGFMAAAPQAASGASATYKLATVSLPNGTKPILRWNPCQRVVTYKVNLAAVPSASRARVLSETQGSVARVSAATGISFSYKGSTSEVPQPGSASRQSAEVIIAWTTPSKTQYSLAGSVAGQGGFSYAWAGRTVNGASTYSYAAQRGFVVIDTPQALSQLTGGYGTGLRRTNLVMHELGHAVGLQHVSDTRQLMYPSLRSAGPSGFAAGDKAGLAKVGRAAGCLTTTSLPYADLS
ncbi:matrixin family metalloprotease [Knoellia koreensis]|uniref:Matrixin family metalloprotease n=1 Tax=Knoellia koreensis TaxID=2730921 RepID=A0A849HJN3_9MICO|nr:matrixin family metalloprotease [Knoellia sp. DB2414S]NNM46754.1 matrixin family metalloprotease [Knoellia sp. DB2414S]